MYFGVQVRTVKLSLCFQDFRKISDAEGFWETIVSKLLITFIVASLLFLNTYKKRPCDHSQKTYAQYGVKNMAILLSDKTVFPLQDGKLRSVTSTHWR